MKRLTPFTSFVLLALCAASSTPLAAQTNADSAGLEFPPEWMPHEAVWMGWSDDTTHHPVQAQMIEAMAPHVPIRMMVTSDSVRAHAMETLHAAGIDTGAVEYVVHSIPNFWTRDPGPLFLTDGTSLAVAGFRWDEYGYPAEQRMIGGPLLSRRGEIAGDVAELMGLETLTTDVVAEGGGIEVSEDVLLTYRQTALQRNPHVPLEEIEREYLRMYGKEKIVWLSRSPLSDRIFAGPKLANYFGTGANGHIDEYVRFVNDSTILVAQVDSADAAIDELAAADREVLLENLAELRAATDADGRPFRVVTLPAPALHHYMWTDPLAEWMTELDPLDAVYRDFELGDEIDWVPAMGYMNFFVTNDVVLVARYWREGLPEREREKDEEVRAKLQELFPDREIVQIDPLAVNFSGGGMHCIVQQQPKAGP